MENNISILGQNIKRIRQDKGFSAYKLSKISNVSQTTISQIENGNRQNLKSETLKNIATALNVSVNDLVESATETIYEVSDLREYIKFILESDDISIKGKTMTSKQKEKFLFGVDVLINTILDDEN